MQDFKKLKVWEKAHSFVLSLYRASSAFPKEELYGLTSQARRAAISIASNIAEGCGKQSNADFAKFLNIALGSANETEYYLILANDLRYFPPSDHEPLFSQINEIKGMLIGLIAKVRSSETRN